MTKATTDVSIIIVNWNTCGLLRDCLASISRETAAAHEVIVIDNASSDGSAAMVAAEFPDTVLIANSVNRGFAAANNQGLAVAAGAHVLLLNPDTIILDGAIDRMLDWLRAHPDVGCVGCQVLTGPGVIQQTGFADHSPLNLAITLFGLRRLSRWVPAFRRPGYDDWDRCSERDVDVVTGVFMLVPREVLEAVGPLDEAFFVYAEEADWCRRIRAAGWRCVIAPEARIIHLDGGRKSTRQIRPRMHVQLQKSQLIYVRKHYGMIGFVTVKALYILSSLLRYLAFGLIWLVAGGAENRARISLAWVALRFHLLGREPSA